MIGAIEILFSVPVLVLLFVVSFFSLEIFGAFLPRRKRPVVPRPENIAVVIPAHNEGEGLAHTLKDVKEQLATSDRLLVVADNCSDNTADIAKRWGAECLVRQNEDQRGKGYALQFALDHLKGSSPSCVYFLDADCRLTPNSIETAVCAAMSLQRPVQSLYLMQSAPNAPAKQRVSEFAWMIINRVRMSGLYRLFDVTRLTGAGMAMPWPLAETLNVASGEIVEDLSVTIAVTNLGAPPAYVGDALVTSEFPTSEAAAAKQRARWEHGSMRLANRQFLTMVSSAISKRDPRILALAFDLSIPPLTLLAMLMVVFLIASSAVWLFSGLSGPLWLTLASLALFSFSVFVSWVRFGRGILRPGAMLDVARYIISKRKVYDSDARRSTETWTRTERMDRPGDPQ